jgi:SSS family solute:Na+ symporter
MAITYLIGAISGPLFLTRIRQINVHTIDDFFALRYKDKEKAVRLLLGFSMICRNVSIIGSQFTTIAFMLSIGFKVDFDNALIYTAFFIVIYTALSGMWGVAGTDILQGIIQMIGIPLLILFVIESSGGLSNILNFYYQIDGESFLNLFPEAGKISDILFLLLAPGLFFLIEDQTTWQRILSSKSDKIAFWGYLTPLCAALILTLMPAFLGVFSKVIFPNFTAYPVALIDYILSLPQPAAILIMFAIISAAISTCDSYLLASGVIISRNLITIINMNASEKQLILTTRIGIIVTGALSLFASTKIYDIFELYMLGAYIGGSIITVPYLLTWFSKRMNGAGLVAGMVCGSVSFYGSVYFFNNTYATAMVISMIINLVSSYLICLLSPSPDISIINKTYYFSPRFSDTPNIPR